MSSQYIVQRPTAADNRVNAWAVQYIPFEPKDWRRTMRDELRQAISEISPDDSGLDVQLHIPDTAWCNMAVLIKPLLDGVISAFHQYSGPCDNVLLQRLSVMCFDPSTPMSGKLKDMLLQMMKGGNADER